MRIAIYSPSWPPGKAPNGIVTYASHLVPALRRLGHEVFVLTFATAEPDPYTIELRHFVSTQTIFNRAMIKLMPDKARYNLMSTALTRAVRHLVSARGVEVMEIEESFGWSYALSRLNIIPVVVRLHGPWFLMGRFDRQLARYQSDKWKEKMEGLSIEHAHCVTANCNDTVSAVRRRYGLPLAKCQIIPTPIEPRPEIETWNIDTCKPDSILFIGRFDKVKGGELVLEAFANLGNRNPQLCLTFVGPDHGVQTPGGERLSFEQVVDRKFSSAVRRRIDFRGKLSHEEVMGLRTKHYLTIAAAQYDTMGYMVVEAMSLGCPLVTTAVGGIPEFIHDRQNGMLVPSQDLDAMTSACRVLLEDRSLAASIGRQAWLDCRRFSPDIVARQTLAVYKQALIESGPSGGKKRVLN